MRTDRQPIFRHDPPRQPGASAEGQLRFIRQVMERTAAFTAVSGWGGVAMGMTALVAAAVAMQAQSVVGWMRVWAAEALIGFIIGAVAITWKARRHGIPLLSGQGRKFLLCLGPAILAGAALTLAIYGMDVGPGSSYTGVAEVTGSISLTLLPATWLLLYGVGVIGAGIFSVRPVPILGAAIMTTGLLALITPVEWGNFWMALGFGVVHIVFGVIIARKYGG